ncbi:MAG TPA: MFS transporter, partial [Methanobacterium sp.]|nr:MFS transporter [Methanobacterium sp.]
MSKIENEKTVGYRDILKDNAWKFIILLGLVSLLADMTYEGARSITGPYIAILGASAAVVGLVSGLGELVGYGLRFISGYLSDKTHRYWSITITGYVVNLLAVPLLALAGSWEIAAILLILERLGKAIRTPARDVMLSHATSSVSSRWGFGFHEAMDQVGAILGPLMVAIIFYCSGSYQMSFAFLIIPAILALSVLVLSRFLYPRPHDLESSMPKFEGKGFKHVYWLYIIAVALIAAGYTDFPLIAYHFQKAGVMMGGTIAIFLLVCHGCRCNCCSHIRQTIRQGWNFYYGSSCTFISFFCTPGIFWRILRSFSWNGNMGGGYGCSRIYNAGCSCRNV